MGRKEITKTVKLTDGETQTFNIEEEQIIKITGKITGHSSVFTTTGVTAKITDAKSGVDILNIHVDGNNSAEINERKDVKPGAYQTTIFKTGYSKHKYGGGNMTIEYIDIEYTQEPKQPIENGNSEDSGASGDSGSTEKPTNGDNNQDGPRIIGPIENVTSEDTAEILTSPLILGGSVVLLIILYMFFVR